MIVCLLLAAGSSSRMNNDKSAGREAVSKLLLPFGKSTFLQHIITEVQAAGELQPVIVTGCYHERIKTALEPQSIDIVHNQGWEEGIGSSIKTGVAYILQQYPAASALFVLVCDQPFVSSVLLKTLISIRQKTKKGIVACTYGNTFGTPVLFDKKYFDELLQLPSSSGAKKIVGDNIIDAALVEFEKGATDIDTAADYDQLQSLLAE